MMSAETGLASMQAEMTRQRADALATLAANGEAASRVARAAAETGSLILCAMGGSHHVNTIAAPLYRGLKLDVRAVTASDLLASPLPRASRTVLIASQSGRSGEIVELLWQFGGDERLFALTLDGESPLARACEAALVAHGGPEQAFAATRSITLTLAMHAAVLEALGAPQTALRRVLEPGEGTSAANVDAAIAASDAVIFAGYGAMAGVAGSAALSMMELARVPTIAFEGGQFRHGPFEVLRPGLAVVLFRSAGAGVDLVPPLAEASLAAGCVTVVFDASGRPPVADVLTVELPTGEGLAAAAAMLLALQPLNIGVAQRRISAGVGTPLRTSKVTV